MNAEQEKQIRRKIYEHDKLINVIAPFGPRLFILLEQILHIAETHEQRDSMLDAHELLANIKQRLIEEYQ